MPRELAGTALTFRYNPAEELEALVEKTGTSLAAIVMEPMRFTEPTDNFLQRVREIADRTGAVLIFDEITRWLASLPGRECICGWESIRILRSLPNH